MPTNRRAVLAAVAATGSIAGCLGGGGGDGDGTGDGGGGGQDDATDSPADGSGDGDGATVAVAEHDELGEILVDGEGMTLYMFDSDTEGESESTCYDDCADAWPPLVTDGEPTAGEGVSASLSTFERENGDRQVAAGGWPLYYFASDESPGDAAGQGVNDVWWVLGPDGTPVRGGETETATGSDSGGSDGDDDDSYY